MTTALDWIRKSKGSDDDIGLEAQREQVHELAETVADDITTLDLGVQTGFSSMTRDGNGLLDQRDDVQTAIDDLAAGEYDYLVALDDNRVCRDNYFSVIEYAMKQGGCEFAYVADIAEDDLTHDLKRRIERDTKEDEIRKARQAVKRRQAEGKWQGGAPFGTHFPDGGDDLARDPDEWPTLQLVFDLLNQSGYSYRDIAAETDLSKGGISNIKQRGRGFYERYGDI